jgi:hypothetical protein
MSTIAHALVSALWMTFSMGWEILWALIWASLCRASSRRLSRAVWEGHAAMDMSVGGDGSILARIVSPKGFTAISHYFVP